MAAAVALPLLALLAASTPTARALLTERAVAALAVRLPQARLTGQVRLDWRLRLVAGPLVLPGPEAAGPPLVTVERVRVRPSARGLLHGRLEPAAVLVEGVRVDVDAGARGEALAQLVRGLRERPRPAGGGPGSADGGPSSAAAEPGSAGGAEPEVT